MKVNNFDALVQNVKYIFVATDAFNVTNKFSLYLAIDNNGNGSLVINPSNTDGLEYLDDVRCDEDLSFLSETDRINLVVANEQNYEDMAYMFLECSMVEAC